MLDYLIYLRDDQKLAASTVNQALVPIRILYRDVLGRDWKLRGEFYLQRREPLPTVLTREEVGRVLACVHEGRFRAVLSLVYHCGLRLSEALKLKPTDIDSGRGVSIGCESSGNITKTGNGFFRAWGAAGSRQDFAGPRRWDDRPNR